MSDRAVSEVLGYALVFSLVIVMVGIISVTGLSGYQSAQTFERETNAGKAFDVMHNNIEDIYYKGAPSRATEIDLGETQIRLGEEVKINITADSPTVGVPDAQTNVTTRPIVQNLGDDSKLVYEAGAVFQTQRQGGIVRRPPPMMFRNNGGTNYSHLILSNITQGGRTGIGNGIVRVRARSLDKSLVYRNTSRDPNVDVTVRIESPRRDLWYDYLTEQPTFTEAACQKIGTETVKCTAEMGQVYVVRSDLEIFFDR